MTEDKGFMLFTSQKSSIDYLTDEQAGELFKALYSYAADDSSPSFENRLLMPLFLLIKDQIDRSWAAYESRRRTNAINAKKRYKAKDDVSHAIASDGMRSHAMAGNNKNNDKNKNNDVSIDNIIVEDDDDSFEKVWKLYNKPVGNKEALRETWNALSDKEKNSVLAYIPRYIKSRPNPKYRRNLDNFLTMRVWETEPIIDNNNETGKINWTNSQGLSADKREEHEQLVKEVFNSFDIIS